MEIPAFYANIFKGYTKDLMTNLLIKCEHCQGLGYIVTSVDAQLFKDCQCILKYQDLKKYTNSGISVKHLGRDDAWFQKEFCEQTYNKMMEIKKSLRTALRINFLIYPAANNLWGASHIGNQIAKYCIDDGMSCAIASSKNIMELFFSWDRADLAKCIEYLQWVDILVIDEFGSEYNSKMKENKSFVANSFNAFLMERKRLNKPTIIASNFHAKYLKETYASEIRNIIFTNFVGLAVKSTTKRKTEFDGIGVKLQRPELTACFDDLSVFDTDKKKGIF